MRLSLHMLSWSSRVRPRKVGGDSLSCVGRCKNFLCWSRQIWISRWRLCADGSCIRGIDCRIWLRKNHFSGKSVSVLRNLQDSEYGVFSLESGALSLLRSSVPIHCAALFTYKAIFSSWFYQRVHRSSIGHDQARNKVVCNLMMPPPQNFRKQI